jgi:DNA-binding IclR family transcriptional regulator
MATPLVDRHAITPPAPDAPTPRGGRSSFIERALQVMDHLQATAKPATAYDIARSISAPVSTVYLVTEELVRQRMLARNDAGEIWLGPRLFHYGLAYASSIDVLTVATDQMHALSRTIGETVQLCGRDEDRMVVMALAIGPGAKRVPTRVGARVPLNWTASGRLLVGHLPMAERIAVFERSARPSPTGRAGTDAASLARAAGEALAGRLAVQVGESDFAVGCVAAPIRGTDGSCLATISIVVPDHKLHIDPDGFTGAVQQAALAIEHRLESSDGGLAG